jgi:hypothetical protein
MEAKEAAEVIDAMANSLEKYPGQFHFQISIKSVAMSIVSNQGIGQQLTVTGGAENSRTIGQKLTATGGDASFEIRQKMADAETQERMKELVSVLRAAADEFNSPKPDAGKLKAFRDGLKEWVPSLIVNVLGTVIASYIQKV